MLRIGYAAGLIGAGMAVAAQAVEVNFDGTVENICTISSATDGVLATSPDGRTLDSELTGGSAGSVTVISTGVNDLTFGAPTLAQAPSGYAGTPTINIAYSGAGVAQNDTSATTTQSISYPGGVIEIDASAVDPAGFPAGAYQVRTIVTCAPSL